jgi:hypothetical protein
VFPVGAIGDLMGSFPTGSTGFANPGAANGGLRIGKQLARTSRLTEENSTPVLVGNLVMAWSPAT